MSTIEDVRSYWNNRPCNIQHSDAPLGSPAYYNEVEVRKYAVEPHILDFAQFPRWSKKYVLEIGCGIGTDTVNFIRAGAGVVATDLSERSLRLAEQRAWLFCPDASFAFVHVNGEEMSGYLHPGYDLVYSFGVIHHSPRPGKILREARKLIAADGELRVMVYHRRSTKVLGLVLRHPIKALHGIDEAVRVQSEAQTGCPITFTYTRKQAKRLVEDAGFKVEDIYVDHIFPYEIKSYRKYRYIKRWYWKWMPEKLFRALEQKFGWHLMIVAKPEEAS